MRPLDIQVLDALGVGQDEGLAGQDFFAHQGRKRLVSPGGILYRDLQQRAG